MVDCWFFQNPASLPHVRQVKGFSQVFPSYATQYAWGDGDDNDVDGAQDESSSDRCSWDQAPFGCFIWGPFGRLLVSLRKEEFLRDALRLPPARPWGLGTSGPCVGPRAASVFPIPSLVLDST
jgi:hypothetical protein